MEVEMTEQEEKALLKEVEEEQIDIKINQKEKEEMNESGVEEVMDSSVVTTATFKEQEGK